jgi:hypothetical protein
LTISGEGGWISAMYSRCSKGTEFRLRIAVENAGIYICESRRFKKKPIASRSGKE